MKIPPDVLLRIGEDHLDGKDLLAYSMLCPSTLQLREKHFRRLKLVAKDFDYPGDISPKIHLLDIARQERPILRSVKDLEITEKEGEISELPTYPSACIEILSALPSVETLRLGIDWSHDSPAALDMEKALVKLVTLPSIKSVTFTKGGIPIVKITNAFQKDSQPIEELSIRGCEFTVLELQARHDDSVPKPPQRDFYDQEKRSAYDEWCQHYWAVSERLAPVHTGRRWLPVSLEVNESPDFWRIMPRFIDTARLTNLTIDWPPKSIGDFGGWEMPPLEQLRILVASTTTDPWISLNECSGIWRARFLSIAFIGLGNLEMKTLRADISAFLAGAAKFENIRIKLLLHCSIIDKWAKGQGGWIGKALASVNGNTASAMLALSISIPRGPRRHPLPWGEPSGFLTWFKSTSATLQSFVPPHQGQKLGIGLFCEKDREGAWDLTPADAEEPPAWLGSRK